MDDAIEVLRYWIGVASLLGAIVCYGLAWVFDERR